MEYPWKIVGYERTCSEKGTEGCRLYIEQQLPPDANGEGIVCGRVWFNPEHVKYDPALGDLVIIIPDDRNKNIVSRIIKVNV